MNETVIKFWIEGDRFMPVMHLIPRFTYSACGLFTEI